MNQLYQNKTYKFLSNPGIIVIILAVIGSCSSKNYTAEEVIFSNSLDSVHLTGTLNLPKEDTLLPAVVLIHGSGAHDRNLVMGKHKIFNDMAIHLASHGIAVLRYDKRGCGESGGIFIPFDLESFSSDGLAAIEYLRHRNRIDTNRIGAIGISQGGIITPLMAANSSNVKFIVMMAGMGVMAQEALHASQMALSKAAGYSGEQLIEVSDISSQLWEILIKDDISENE